MTIWHPCFPFSKEELDFFKYTAYINPLYSTLLRRFIGLGEAWLDYTNCHFLSTHSTSVLIQGRDNQSNKFWKFIKLPRKSWAEESLSFSGLSSVGKGLLKLLQPFHDNKGCPFNYAARWRESQLLGYKSVNEDSPKLSLSLDFKLI